MGGDEDVIDRLVVYDEFSLAVIDESARRIYLELLDGILKGDAVVLLFIELQISQAHQKYCREGKYDDAQDVISIFEKVFIHREVEVYDAKVMYLSECPEGLGFVMIFFVCFFL